MATIGAGINPSLGAINYSPIIQGAQMQAQGVMEGGRGIAQGISSVGASIGGALQKYYDNKETKELVTNTSESVKKFLSANPQYAQQLGVRDINDDKAIGVAIKAAGGGDAKRGAMVTQSMIGQFAQMADQQKKLQKDIMDFNTGIQTGSVPRGANPQVAEAVQNFIKANAEMKKTEAETAKLLREAAAPDGGKVVDPVAIRVAGPNGEPVERTVDRLTGKVIAEGPVSQNKYVRTPEEEAEAAGLIASVKKDVDFLDTVPMQAVEADSTQSTINELRGLLQRDTTKTGSMQTYVTDLRAMAKRLGFPDAALADQQRMESLIAEDPLRQTQQFLKGQGQVSNAERDRIDRLALNANKDKKALLELLDYRDALAARARGAEQERQRLFDEGKGTRQIAESLRRWYSKNTVTGFLKDVRQAQEYDFTPALNIISGKQP